jgi:hypothetical protein
MELLRKPAVTFSLINSALAFIAWLAFYLSGNIELLFTFAFVIIMLVVGVSLMVAANLKTRKEFQGHFNFSEALKSGLLFLGIGWIAQVAFNQLMYRVVDPELPAIQKEINMRKMEERMVRWNVPEAEIAKTMDKMEKADPLEMVQPASIMKGLVYYSFFALIFASIVALFTRAKKHDPFAENATLDGPGSQQEEVR